MERIERQRDELEEERVKEVIRRMNEECESALRNQWRDAEDLRFKTLDELRTLAMNSVLDEMETRRKLAIEEALSKAQAI